MDISLEISVICTRYAPCDEWELGVVKAGNIIFIVSLENISGLISRAGQAGLCPKYYYCLVAPLLLPPHLMQKIRERKRDRKRVLALW